MSPNATTPNTCHRTEDQSPFFLRKSDKELYTRYLDTYLPKYDSVLPPHYLRARADGTVEEVPIPPTRPEKCPPALRGVKVSDDRGFSSEFGVFCSGGGARWIGGGRNVTSRLRKKIYMFFSPNGILDLRQDI